MEYEPDRKYNRQVQVSMEVMTSEGTLIGYVTEVGKRDFTVHHLIAPDVTLEYSYIETIEGNAVNLNVTEHELALRNPPAEGALSSIPHPHRK